MSPAEQIRKAFLNSLVARASYADITSEDELLEKIQSPNYQSQMTSDMAAYFVSRYAYFTHSLDSLSGYDGILFQLLDEGSEPINSFVLGNRGTQFLNPGDAEVFRATLTDLIQDGYLALAGVNEQLYEIGALINIIPSGAEVEVAGHSLGGFLTLWTALLFNDRVVNAYTYNGAGIQGGEAWLALMNEVRSDSGLTDVNMSKVFNYFSVEYPEVTAALGEHFTPPQPVYIDDEGIAGTTIGHGIISHSNSLLVAYVLSSIDGDLSLGQINRIVESETGGEPFDRNSVIAYLGEIFGYDSSAFERQENEDALQRVAFAILGKTEVRAGVMGFDANLVDFSSIGDGDVAALAVVDSGNGALIRHALLRLSSFALQNPTGMEQLPDGEKAPIVSLVQSDELKMYDESTGVGELTEAWIQDRARMASSLARAHIEGVFEAGAFEISNGVSGRTAWQYEDVSLNEKVRVVPSDSGLSGAGLPRHYVIFGSDDDNSGEGVEGSAEEDHIYGGGGNDVIAGNGGADYLEGGSGNDVLKGGEGRDTLYGLQGNDTLIGGKDADRLEGGLGLDVYSFEYGEGVDDIYDVDGVGYITIDGTELGSGVKEGNGWVFEDSEKNRFYYFLSSDSDGSQTLQIFPPGKNTTGEPTVIYINNFVSGQLGIDLQDSPEPILPSDQMIGDLLVTDFQDPDGNGGTITTHHFDGNGNLVGVSDGMNRPDVLLGNANDNHIKGLFGNDSLYGKAGDDTILGDVGHDLIAGGAGKDTIQGDDGDDLIYGDGDVQFDKVPDRTVEAQSDPYALGTFLYSGIDWTRYQVSTSSVPPVTNANPDAITPILLQLNPTRFGATGRHLTPVVTWGQDFGADDFIDGGIGNDVIYGETGSDNILAGAGSDKVYGGAGNDVVDGGADDDLILGDAMVYAQFLWTSNDIIGGYYRNTAAQETYKDEFGNDRLSGGSGNDYIFGMAGADLISGEEGNDYLVGDFFEVVSIPVLTGYDANGNLVGDTTTHFVAAVSFHGNDILEGGLGDDYLIGLAGNDKLLGGAGKDVLLGDGNPDEVQDRYGDDELFGGADNDFLQGSGGKDSLDGGTGDDELWGDEYVGTDGQPVTSWGGAPVNGSSNTQVLDIAKHDHDDLYGGEGKDTLTGGGANDTLDGGSGDDLIFGDGIGVTGSNEGDDTLYGRDGDDQLQGNGGNDSLYGGEGLDKLYGQDGTDSLLGEAGDDYLEGGKGDDTLDGGDGIDTLWGNDDNDTLLGGAGDDLITGGAGNDTITGGVGRDYQDGGAGNDVYVLKAGDGQIVDNTYEMIVDSAGTDTLRIEGVDPAAIVIRKSATADDIALQYGSNDGVYIKGGLSGAIETVAFVGGATMAFAEFLVDRMVDPLSLTAGSSGTDLAGGKASDSLTTKSSNTVIAGAGNDVIGVYGDNNTVVMRQGDGVDTVTLYNSPAIANRVRFGAGITPSDIQMSPVVSTYYSTLNIRIKGNAGNGLVFNGFNPNNPMNYQIVLGYFDFTNDDGSIYTLTYAEMVANGFSYSFTGGADTITGTSLSETFDGLGGNDEIRAGDGDDVLRGGAGSDALLGDNGSDLLEGGIGNDYLSGGSGIDTYVFGKGDGVDTIDSFNDAGDKVLLAHDAAQATFRSRDDDLIMTFENSQDQVVVQNYFARDGAGFSAGIDIVSADGVHYDYAAARAKALQATAGNDFIIGMDANDSISGLAGDDTLAGGDGNDTLDGGAGDDILALEAGDDTFVFGVGSGHDTIQSVSYVPTHYGVGSDTILISALLPSQVMATRVSADLMALSIFGTDDWIAFSSTNPGFADLKVRFADGTVWTSAMVQAAAPLSEGADTLSLLNTDDSLHVLGGNDTVHARGGNDSIYGDAGNDVLNGGDGNDYLDGGIGDDTLRGEAGDDSLSGEDGIDVLYGGTGNDSLSGGAGKDTLYGEDGSDGFSGDRDGQIDTFVGGNDNDYYYLGEGIDQIVEALDGGNDSVNLSYSGTYKMATYVENVRLYWGDTGSQITGNAQDNYIDAEYSTQADTLSGGAGDDTYYHVTSVDQVIESSTGGIDTVYAARDTYYLDQYIENAILINRQGGGVFYSTWRLTGNASNNYLANHSTFKAEIYGGGGDDTIYGSWGDTLYGEAGNDSLYNGGTIYGGAGTNLLVGSGGGNALFSQGVNDVLYGGGGYDSFNLGAGFATCVMLAGDEYAAVNTGTGEYALEFRDAQLADISVKVNQSYQLEITYEAGGVVVMSTDSLGKLRNIVTQEGAMTAAAWFDWLKTSPGYYTGNIKLVGTGAESTASARYTIERTGGDLLLGSLGAAGQPLGSFSLGAVTPMDNTDAYRIEADGRLRLVAVGDGPTSFQLSGFNFHAGSALADDLTNVGKNWALDWYVGGAGRDTYTWGLKSGSDVVDATTPDGVRDVVLIEAGLDLSTLRMEQSADDLIIRQQNGYTLSLRQYFRNEPSAPIILFADGSELTLAGLYYGLYRATEGDDVITGSHSAEKLFGWAGNDVLQGLGGNDTLDGGAGLDQLMGGNGDDIYYYADQDVITEIQYEGYDRVHSWLSMVLPQHVEAVVLMGSDTLDATGNDAANSLDGNAAANQLDGGAGADNLRGGAGDDLYIVDNSSDYVYEGLGEGQDRVESSASFVLASHVEDLTLTGTLAINGTGNDLANVIRGNIAANALAGGLGDDTYYIANGDTVTENSGAGHDTVISEVSFVLGSNMENLRLVEGSGAVSATGNVLINNLYGNAMSNTLNGGTGADNMEGGAGDDTYVVDNVGDLVVEKLGEGTDTVQSSVAYLLSANVENLTLTGSASVGATGNGLDNMLAGNSGANVMVGGAGNDTYVVTAKDTIKENVGEGIDTIRSAGVWTLGANLENIVLTGTSKVAATGNELNNRLDGSQNTAANALKGGKGNDTYLVGTGDVITENLGEGSDTVESSIAWTLGANLENLTLTGSTAINGVGNTLANQLRGNSASNTLTGLAGNDTYLFGRGGGADTIVDSDSTAGNQDVLRLDAGIAHDQLWFRQVSNHLEVSVIGGSDKVTISNWYTGGSSHVEKLQLADGHYLLDSRVAQLVQAMATMTPPPLGQTSLSDAQRQQLDPVLASSWQAA